MSEERQGVARRVGLTRSDSQAYYERGLEAFATHDYENAILDLSEAIHFDRGRAELYSARGLIYMESGKLDDAQTDLQYALKLNRRQWLAHYCFGVMAFNRSAWAEAIDHFTKAQTIAPGRPEAWFYRAVALHNTGDDAKALTDMQTALRWFEEGDKRRGDATKWIKELSPP